VKGLPQHPHETGDLGARAPRAREDLLSKSSPGCIAGSPGSVLGSIVNGNPPNPRRRRRPPSQANVDAVLPAALPHILSRGLADRHHVRAMRARGPQRDYLRGTLGASRAAAMRADTRSAAAMRAASGRRI